MQIACSASMQSMSYHHLLMSGAHAGAGAVQVSNVEALSSGTTQAGTQGVLARVTSSPSSEQCSAKPTNL